VDTKELTRQSHKTVIFRTYFANFGLRDTFGARSQRALHLEKQQKNSAFITFLTPSLGPTWGTTRNINNCKMSATLHGSAPAEKKASAMLYGNAFAVWMVQMRPPKKASLKQPKPFILSGFARFLDPISNAPVPNGNISKRTPRCMGAYFFRFVFKNERRWVPPKCPKPFILNGLERLIMFLV